MAKDIYRSGSRNRYDGNQEARAAMCEGKPALTWAKVVAVKARMGRRRAAVAYHCPVCRAWHVGSPMKREKKTRWKER